MTRLSVNINKIATLRNARGGNNPDVLQHALAIERYGADGITVHPRPDERHIRYDDVRQLKKHLQTELNIEGNPKEPRFVDLVMEVKPTQVTLVPDSPDQLTSNHGWDTLQDAVYLKEIIARFKDAGIRVSIFVDPMLEIIEGAQATGTDRIELYTESYAHAFASRHAAEGVEPFKLAAVRAYELGLGINAGHDLDLHNLAFFNQHVPHLDEVSIGHALISDALLFGMENTVQLYKRQLNSVYS
jgi:pyridoxine 5-phosphate synthase